MNTHRGKNIALFLFGGSLYYLIEVVWKAVRGGELHWSMFVLGGISFILVGLINELFTWDMSFILQSLIGGCLITGLEFITGMIVNVWLRLDIWDYSHLPLNIMGQVCLPFFCAWVGLAGVAIWLDDLIRYLCFGEEKPRYKLV